MKLIQTFDQTNPVALCLARMYRENRIVSMFGEKLKITDFQIRDNGTVRVEAGVVKCDV